MNKVMLIGNVGKEPDVRYYDQDQAVATFSLATTERGYTLQNGTKVPDHTDWHTVMAWRGLAKIVEKYVHKGDKLYIEGRIRYRSYDDQKGQRRFVTEILAENMELLTPRPVANEASAGQSTAADQTQQTNQREAENTPDDGGLPF
ncbi:MAG: single-stranded DNA-binding protein [Prevotella salivae]|uniref:single-stranded DNA-binding protein n=1 Tax=Segatella salivae TaxID=228604 RepID=UPI001CAF70CE|nr:single-stranded DNA-binding protein [Segatella salivae]MBF1521138.1 single-stranded DNA-binding protein [Segatella salivae]